MNGYKLIAMDLDGTLTQHKSPLSDENRAALDALRTRYHLMMAGAGMCARIFRQMGRYPIDILGNYGMQFCRYDPQTQDLQLVRDTVCPCDRESVERRVTQLRQEFGYTDFAGDNVEYHASGCITFPLLGTAAQLSDKLAFDPTREKRRRIYARVCDVFSDYHVFIGGSSSFDLAPSPYNKAYALEEYCRENGLHKEEVLYIGDDYGMGGNDESVLLAGFPFLRIDDYRDFPRLTAPLLD